MSGPDRQYRRTGSFLVEFENPYDLLSLKADTVGDAAGRACKRLNRPAGDVFRVSASFEPATPLSLQDGVDRHFGYVGEDPR